MTQTKSTRNLRNLKKSKTELIKNQNKLKKTYQKKRTETRKLQNQLNHQKKIINKMIQKN